jgi:hypothetical protein
MYPDGKVLWSGRIDDAQQQGHSNKSSFLCRIRKASANNNTFKIKFIRCDAALIYPIIDMLTLYEQESANVLEAWDMQAKIG